VGGIRLLLATIGLVAVTACSSGGGRTGKVSVDPVPSPTDSISGTVTFKSAPLAGVAVTLWNTNTNTIDQTTTSDSNGNYTFSGLRTWDASPTEYQIWASRADYGFYPSVGAGAKVIRWDHTGQFQGNGVTDIAIYLTVIDYVALSNRPLTNADFNAYDGSKPLVSLPVTGQLTTYVSGDDGARKAGIAWPETHFRDNYDGTVTDNLTGLIWLQDAGCFPQTLWSSALTDANQLAAGACELNDGSTAGQWRLPNVNELESLVDVSASFPAISIGSPFRNVSSAVYWSSTSYFGGQAGSPQAWAIRMGDGRYVNDFVNNIKTTAKNAVWAVKGGGGGAIKLPWTGQYVTYTKGDDGSVQAGVPPTDPRWIDNGNGTISDTVTGLIWLKQADCIKQPWPEAIAAVNSLASGQCGLTDKSLAGSWRMPNRKEMESLSDRMENNHADYFNATYLNRDGTVFRLPIFSNFRVSEYYWTSSTDAANTSEAWTVFSCDFGVYDIPKTSTGYTLAVR
jgi:hypothetical protein